MCLSQRQSVRPSDILRWGTSRMPVGPPPLSIIIGQALSCFLRAQGIGITIEGQNLSAAQFADDMTAFLPSLEQVPEFMSAMTTFGAASGQCLNPDKTKILLMGNLTGGRGPHIDSVDAGNGNTIQVVKRLTILGVSIEACSDREGLGEALPDWAPIQAEVARRGSKISRLPITAFARGCANSAYAMSMLLFQAEFSGLPRATDQYRGYRAILQPLLITRRISSIQKWAAVQIPWHIRSESARESSRWGVWGTTYTPTYLVTPCNVGSEISSRTGSPTVRGPSLGTGSKSGTQRANAQYTPNRNIWLETINQATRTMSSTTPSNV